MWVGRRVSLTVGGKIHSSMPVRSLLQICVLVEMWVGEVPVCEGAQMCVKVLSNV